MSHTHVAIIFIQKHHMIMKERLGTIQSLLFHTPPNTLDLETLRGQ